MKPALGWEGVAGVNQRLTEKEEELRVKAMITQEAEAGDRAKAGEHGCTLPYTWRSFMGPGKTSPMEEIPVLSMC